MSPPDKCKRSPPNCYFPSFFGPDDPRENRKNELRVIDAFPITCFVLKLNASVYLLAHRVNLLSIELVLEIVTINCTQNKMS